MNGNHAETMFEEKYLSEAISQIETLLTSELEKNTGGRKSTAALKKELWDDAELFSESVFERMVSIGQVFGQVSAQMAAYDSAEGKIAVLKDMLRSPYFARIDFTEEGQETEKIYIGRLNIMNDDDYTVYIYDWRAPISSVFYRFELGQAYYDAPMGRIAGEVSLKRQYGIRNGKLNYFFDANINITDEILRKILSENASAKMKAIVETIQRNQDMIIRDMDNELLMVQGVAGSGKTSVALHRVAYLMYQGLAFKLRAGDIAIISPNHLFSRYISDVLPELGETNVKSFVFEDIIKSVLALQIPAVMTRNQLFESLITCKDSEKKAIMKGSMEFKASRTFVTMLERYAEYMENTLIQFEDIYYDDICVADILFMREYIAKSGNRTPLASKLINLENIIFEKIRGMRGSRIKKLENQVREQGGHVLEVTEYARMLSIQESGELLKRVRRFTEIDYLKVYERLISDKALFESLASGLALPEGIGDILKFTLQNLLADTLPYEDGLAVTYLKIKLAGCRDYSNIRQIVVDEAQDYYPVHYEILKALAVNAKYTILGDINQTVEKHTDSEIYNEIAQIFGFKKTLCVSMLKGFRSTDEILDFSERFIESEARPESIERHGEPPRVINFEDIYTYGDSIISEVNESKACGYESIGILCKSIEDAREVYSFLKDKLDIKLIDENGANVITGVFAIPVYLAKGLEFDSVLVYGMDIECKDEAHRKLLYIACTRALHRLVVLNASSSCITAGSAGRLARGK